MVTLKIIRYIVFLSIHWIPRILCILFSVFITLFSFDVFGQETNFWTTLLAFIIHNIPTIIIISVLVLSWKWSWIGAISFISLGVVYLLWLSDNNSSPLIYYPLFVTGVFFLLDWTMRNQIKKARDAYHADN